MTSTSDDPADGRPILAGYDGSAAAHDAALWAAEEAVRRNRPLMLARTYPRETNVATLTWTPIGLPERQPRPAQARQALVDLVRKCQNTMPHVVVTTRLREGDAVSGLTGLADEFDADLVVVGGPHSGVMTRSLVGATTDHLLNAIARPLVVVPDDREMSSTPESVGQRCERAIARAHSRHRSVTVRTYVAIVPSPM
jgi:nucleotide-binding universal stress UspA family protein